MQAEVRDLNFSRVHLIAKVSIAFVTYIRPLVRLPEYMSAAPAGKINVKFDIGHFYENLSRCFKFG